MMNFFSIIVIPAVYATFTAPTIYVKKTNEAEFTAISDMEYETCPTVLEIHNLKENSDILDMAFLEGLCKSVINIQRIRISGNFQGIGEGLFDHLLKLENFQATDMDSLTELSISSSNLKHLDFSRNHLEKVDIEFKDDLVHLNLSRNFLEVQNLYMNTMSHPLSLQLRTLDLSYNRLTKIDFFLSFWNLRNLLLNNNKIEHIKPGMLQKYPNLLVLNLARNKIHEMENGVFIGLTQLVNLDISHNNLNDINVQIINSLRSLEELNLEGNIIDNFKYNELEHDMEILKINENDTYLHGKKIDGEKLATFINVTRKIFVEVISDLFLRSKSENIKLICYPTMKSPTILHITTLMVATIATDSFGKRHDFEFTAIGERDYHHCPTALEIENTKTDEFLDIEYLDGLCKNVVGVLRMRVSGNFYGIAESLFNKLPRLEDFQGNDMVNLTDVTIGTWNLKFLDLSRNNLEKVSIEFMDELMSLNLSRNQLTDDNVMMTSMRPPLSLKLRLLDLSNNKLTKLDTLYPFWNLKKFILNDNQITNIKPGILQRYPNLVTLNLSRNKLLNLPDGMFTGLIHLVNLDLSYNQLSDAKTKIINSLRSLEFLDMIGNDITEFEYEELDHHLEVLRINEQHTYIHGKRVAINKEPKKTTTSTEMSSPSFTYME
ncbi:protein artichoke-like [Coccinella septempunctata]|uniref:protein artichoke-like n=1 Tax=Coccinella septempunctata TaxID=41139 RepID=UPI001D0859B5|nr:protein artichoke-like [Coccinella septempunctata]